MKRTVNTYWNGNLTPYSFKTRFGSGIDTNPEELIAVAPAGCFTVSVNTRFERTGFIANDLKTETILDVDMANLRSLVFNWV
jgi:osmotically inducible protein OsmC